MISFADFRTFLRTNRISGPFLNWLWTHYITAICVNSPNDCSDIPKVENAGGILEDPIEESRPYQLMHNGLKLRPDSYYGDFATRIVQDLRGHHEPQEEKVFHEVLQSLPQEITMLEVGSYWGYYSMWAQKAKKAVRNILIEPVEENLQIGRENFAFNSMSGEFHRAYIGATSKKPDTKFLEGMRLENVARISIDDALGRFDVSFAHIIHADVQGAELELLKGSERTMRASRIGYFFLSTHGARLHSNCMRFLRDRGFLIITSHTRRESFTADGLIVARHRSFDGIGEVRISKNNLWNEIRCILKYVLSGLPLHQQQLPGVKTGSR